MKFWFAFFTLCGAFCVGQEADIPPAYGQPLKPRLVANVQLLLSRGSIVDTELLVAQARRLNGDTPETLEALGWVARGELANHQAQKAFQTAEEIQQSARKILGTRSLDAEPHLPLAFGTAYEVQAQSLFLQGKRAASLDLLRKAMAEWHDSSLGDRLQKNINLMTLNGLPMPLIRAADWAGAKPQPAAWKGKVVLLFFWAHWCPDCKRESPLVAKLAAELGPRGLVVVAPTRLYGYTADDEHASAAKERAFVGKVFDRYYANIPKVEAPVDASNFRRYGVSTTPTIVVVDRRGVVRFYNPGAMLENDLRSVIEPLLQSK